MGVIAACYNLVVHWGACRGMEHRQLPPEVSEDPVSSDCVSPVSRTANCPSWAVRGPGERTQVAKTLNVPHFFPLLCVQGSRSSQWKRDLSRASVLIVFRSKFPQDTAVSRSLHCAWRCPFPCYGLQFRHLPKLSWLVSSPVTCLDHPGDFCHHTLTPWV